MTRDAVLKHKADLGVAWDGDFDRCFLWDETGEFIEGYYIVGLLAKAMLAKEPGAKIVHDPRLTWASIEMIEQLGGVAVQSKSGHAFMKDALRKVDAVYGGEMSAHHFFRRFAYCDSGMIPWLLTAQILADEGKPLSELVGERMRKFPVSGEINRKVGDTARPAGEDREDLRRPGREVRPHRRPGRGAGRVALQRTCLQHRTPGAAQRGDPRRCQVAGSQDRRGAGVDGAGLIRDLR